MSGKRSSKALSSSSQKKKKKRERDTKETHAKVQGTLAGFSQKKTKDIVDMESLNKLHTGKRIFKTEPLKMVVMHSSAMQMWKLKRRTLILS